MTAPPAAPDDAEMIAWLNGAIARIDAEIARTNSQTDSPAVEKMLRSLGNQRHALDMELRAIAARIRGG